MKSKSIMLLVLIVTIIGITTVLIIVKNNSKPDLIISDLRLVDEDYLSSSTFTITIKNAGDKSARLNQLGSTQGYGLELGVIFTQGKTVKAENYTSHSKIYHLRYPYEELEPEQSIEDTLVIDKPKLLEDGEYLTLIVDPENRILELTKENNTHSAPIFNASEKELIQQRMKIPLEDYLKLFTYDFPQEVYLGRPPKGKSWLSFNSSIIQTTLQGKLIQLENGTLLGPVYGYPYAYKKLSSEVIWICALHKGEYGGDTSLSLYVLNLKKHTISHPYLLSKTFGEDGWYDYQDGEFINDSSFQYRHYWNDESYKADSAKGTMIIR